MKTIEENKTRYVAATHAMQSGVAMAIEQGDDEATPKHLRVGVNCALRDHGSLIKLLIDKGIISEEEYTEALADGMEEEAKGYEKELSEKLGCDVKLA